MKNVFGEGFREQNFYAKFPLNYFLQNRKLFFLMMKNADFIKTEKMYYTKIGCKKFGKVSCYIQLDANARIK